MKKIAAKLFAKYINWRNRKWIKNPITSQENILKRALSKGEELDSDNLNAVDSENYTPLMVASREILFPPKVYRILLDGETYTLMYTYAQRGWGACAWRGWGARI